MENRYKFAALVAVLALSVLTASGYGQIRNRIGTTGANFLEIGVGGAGSAMGEAYVASAQDPSAVYWNPAGLAFLASNQVQVVHQPWIAGIQSSFIAGGFILPAVGTLAMGINYMNFGEMDVTNLEFPEGNGEKFTQSDFAVSIAYSRKLAQWFSFGIAIKSVQSQIWHSSAKSFALDMGVVVNTRFFSPTGSHEDGMKIGMSISNYGGRLRYDGMDLMNPIDIDEGNQGNYGNASGRLYLTEWELPLIFRVGFAIHAFKTPNHRLTLAADALHPNNNAESVNLGGEYAMVIPGWGQVFLRGGYKALFMPDSEYGPTLGGGLLLHVMRTTSVQLDYAFKTMGNLGNTHCYTIGILF